jgi:hypothetical protein
MRFLLRFERRWLDLLFRAAPLVGLGFAAAPLVFVGAGWSAEYCDIREDGLFESLRELKPRAGDYGVFAIANDGKAFVISIWDTPRFLREAYRRCPRLNPATEEA